MSAFLTVLTIQAVLGSLDNIWHHEIAERLPARRSAAAELGLHGAREALYAFVLIALAWFEWRGVWAALIATVLAAEILITLADFVVEDRTRRLPASERVLHTVLAVNFGVALALLAPNLLAWWRMPAEVVTVEHGAIAWVLTALAIGALGSAARNAIAALGHRRPPEWVRDPIVPAACAQPVNVLVSGATGFIGGHLVRRLVARGDAVTVLTRNADVALYRFGPHVRALTSLDALGEDARIDAVVNLAGARILGLPWTKRRRRALIESRVRTTQALVSFCARLREPPRVFVSGSAVGYYGVRGDERVDERGGAQPIFQSELCRQWEAAAAGVEALGTRLVTLRIGLVLGRDGGALPSLARPMRLGAGAVLGSGRQWVSWIHVDDLVSLVELAVDEPAVRGVLNAVAPHPATHRQLQHALARALHRRVWLRVPAFAMRAALGEMAELLVDGQRVLPIRALAEGFRFRHPSLADALEDLLGARSRAARAELEEIYYNGDCPVCRFEMSHYARLCAANEIPLQFIDASRKPDALAGCKLRGEHLERRVYLRDSAGGIVSGLPALVELWSRLPRYRWLARVASLPLLERVLAALYDLAIAPTLARWAARKALSGARISG